MSALLHQFPIKIYGTFPCTIPSPCVIQINDQHSDLHTLCFTLCSEFIKPYVPSFFSSILCEFVFINTFLGWCVGGGGTHVYRHGHVYTHTCRSQRTTLGTLPPEPSTLCFETGYLSGLELDKKARGQTREPQGSTCVCVCGSGITKTYPPPCQLCNVGS